MTEPAILQSQLPEEMRSARPLPGIQPLAADDWLRRDEVYGAQMAERARLLHDQRSLVQWLDPDAMPAARELLDNTQALLPSLGFRRAGDGWRCPDGREVAVDRGDPLGTLGRLVQEDLCLLEKRGDEHVLTGAVLCFPASWRLSEKAGKPLVAIHGAVAEYDGTLARRVQRLFDGIKPGRPLWRFNRLWYDDPTLFQPRSEFEPRRHDAGGASGAYLRSERQCLRRLPQTGAVLFSIHTYVLARADVPPLD